MSQIADIGDQILAAQRTLGLKNPDFFCTGLSKERFEAIAQFSGLPPKNELRDLFTWKDGVQGNQNTPMKDLWLVPGFYLLSSGEMIGSNKYLSANIPDYLPSWYRLTSCGSIDHQFVDITLMTEGRLPVFDYDPEFTPVISRKYDSIETMFTTILECYKQRAFFLDVDDCLDGDFQKEVVIGREHNPGSEYWWRDDLF